MKNAAPIYSVVQFLENHKWAGSLGIVTGKKRMITENGIDVRYMIAVPIPMRGTAYIYSMQSKNEFDYIGLAKLAPRSDDDG